MPLPDAPAGYFARWNSYAELVRVIESGFPDALFPDQPGESILYGE